MREIDVTPRDPTSVQLWERVGDLVDLLPSDWVLIGGLMVQLHALEHGVHEVRVTEDVDILGQTRPPSALAEIDAALREHRFEVRGPDADGYAYRYERDGLIVDVLSPDGLRHPANLGASGTAVAVPGGTQALARAEAVTVRLGERLFELRRPTLLGAILIKARSLLVHADPDAQREDLLLLLSLVTDPRAAGTELVASERRWLRKAETHLAFDAPSLAQPSRRRTAEQVYQLLVRGPG